MVIAAWMSPTCVYTCGKLPSRRRLSGSTSSEKRPCGLAYVSTRRKTVSASSTRPMSASASAHQKLHMVKALRVMPMSSTLA
jgi:hypothetical protein